jgi:hypothetical protein
MLIENIIFISIITLTSLFGSFFYIRDIIRGKTKPNLVTWFFWALAPLIGTFLQLKAGAGFSVLPVFFAGFFPVIIFFIALIKRNAHWKITTFDIFCGIFSLIALILWIVTKRTDISIAFAILSDGLAAIPTLIKSWKFPETETAVGYVPGLVNNSLGLLMIRSWNFSTYSFGIYFVVLNAFLILLIKRKKFFTQKENLSSI